MTSYSGTQLKLVLQSNLKDIASVHQTFAKTSIKFAEISDADIIFIDNYNSRKRTIEAKFKASKINDLDLFNDHDSHLHGCYCGSILKSYIFTKEIYFFVDTRRICLPKMSLSNLRFCLLTIRPTRCIYSLLDR